MTKARLALIGGGGFAREVAEVAELAGFIITGCYSLDPGSFSAVHRGLPEALEAHKKDYDAVALGMGAVNRRSLAKRNKFSEMIEATGIPCPAFISPHAVCGKGATVADGAFVGHRAVLGVGASVGPFSMVNIGAIVGHDVNIGRNVAVAPGVFIGGGSSVGRDTLLGPLAKILQGVAIGSDVIVGVGCTVLRSLADGSTVWPRPDRTT